ncbi:MAG: type II toxin-antitoxin system RelE/ParE family toxin [Planctomycetes bacterium]|nr:type II toxin-antitoxin system RelE/ParE family toxin [Planctomycetota bacterium]
MTHYAVEVTDTAMAAIIAHARFIAIDRKEPLNAQGWLEAAWDAAQSLHAMPARCAIATETDFAPYAVRYIMAGNTALLFTIDDDHQVVWVIALRGKGQLPRPEQLPKRLASLHGDT